MKIAFLLISSSLIATIAGAQSAPVRVTREMVPLAGQPNVVAHPAEKTVERAAATGIAHGQSVPSGVTYTCDRTVSNLGPICATLNSTIAGLYAAAFSNANARIYVTLGSTGLGASDVLEYSLAYTDYRNALQSSQTDADDVTAFTASVPPTNPITANGQVLLAGPNYRALGFTPANGLLPNMVQCDLSGNACYDGIITISNSAQLYLRDGSTINSGQYDFYTVVEHETDEILGTGSCAFGCSRSNPIAPADLYRYQSTGVLSILNTNVPNNNTSCSVSAPGNACFSIDGVHILQQYNNLTNGDDAGDWLTNCRSPLVQDAVGCLGVANVDIAPAAEIRLLDVIGYSLAVPVSVRVVTKLTSNQTGVVNGVCSAPPSVGTFTVTSPQVWLYFSVTGANIGDTAQMTFIRPDGVVFTTLNSTAVTAGGTQCFSYPLAINGSAAASFPGTWSIQVGWDQGVTPLFALTFNISSANCPYTLDSSGQAFGPAGGSGAINVTAPAGCVWTVSNAPTWITPSGFGGSGNGSVSFQVAPNTGGDRSGSMTVAGVPYSFQQESLSAPGPVFGSMPHIAAEENWTTTFTLVNKGAVASQTRLSFFGDPSDPAGNGALALPLTFPQQPAAAAPLMATSIDNSLGSNASVIITTAGPQNPPVLVGSAQLTASNNVDGFAIFHLIPGSQEAVVPLETRNAPAYTLAYDNTNGVVLGVAVANVSSQQANVAVVIRANSGAVIGTDNLVVPANGHMSFLLSSKYPITGAGPGITFPTGSIEFDPPSGGQISVLGIRTTPLGTTTTLTTVPALANVGTNGGSIAHLATGNGWQTTIVLVNTGTLAAQANLRFFADTGIPLSLPISFPPAPSTTVVSTLTQTLAAGGMLLVQSVKPASDSAPTIGSAQLTTNGNVSGFVIFRYNPNGQEAVVPLDGSTIANARIIAFDNTNGTSTGIAVNSLASSAVNIPVVVRDDTGAQLATDTITLSANGHYAFTMGSDRYQIPQVMNGRGTIEFDTPAGGQISALGIRIPQAHTFTSLPALIR